MNCTTHHICECQATELERLRATSKLRTSLEAIQFKVKKAKEDEERVLNNIKAMYKDYNTALSALSNWVRDV